MLGDCNDTGLPAGLAIGAAIGLGRRMRAEADAHARELRRQDDAHEEELERFQAALDRSQAELTRCRYRELLAILRGEMPITADRTVWRWLNDAMSSLPL